jgi:hypothetical protein
MDMLQFIENMFAYICAIGRPDNYCVEEKLTSKTSTAPTTRNNHTSYIQGNRGDILNDTIPARYWKRLKRWILTKQFTYEPRSRIQSTRGKKNNRKKRRGRIE